MAKASSSKIDPELEKAINKLLKEVTIDKMEDVLDDQGNPKEDSNGKKIRRKAYSLTDVMKVIDRKLKLEGIKAKVDDAGYGSGFGSNPDDDDALGDD